MKNLFKINILFICIFFAICHLPLAICQNAQDVKEDEALFVAKQAFADGFYDVSLGLLERFLKNYPVSGKGAEVNLLIGQCFFHQNKFLDALVKFEELLNNTSANQIKDAVVYWIAEVHFKGNNFSKAAVYYRQIIDNFTDSQYLMQAHYSHAWCLFQEGKYGQALEYFKLVEEKYPQEIQAQDASFKIIECLYNLKDYNALKVRLKSYLKRYAKDPAQLSFLYFYLAESEYYLNNFNEGIEDYLKVIQNTQDQKLQGLAGMGMGWAYLKLKKYQEAQDAFGSVKSFALERKSQDVLFLGRATLYSQTGKFSEAEKLYGEIINMASDAVIVAQAYLGKADALYNLGEYKKAIGVYKEALAKGIADAITKELIDKLHYGLAWAHLKEGEFKEAIDEFQKIAKETEDKTIKIAALCQVGDTYHDSGEYDKAIKIYDTILKDYPESLYSDYVQYQLGLTLLKVSNYDGAILSFRALKTNFPASKLLDDATYALGLSYFQKEDYNSSKETFEKFQDQFQDSPLKPQGIYLLGTSLYNLGKFTEAIEVFKNIIRLYSQDQELTQKAEYEIADCFYRMGNENEAVERFKALRSKYPDSGLTPEIMWWLGEYYYRHNDLNLARRYFSAIIQDFPKSNLIPDAYYILGSTYQEAGGFAEALTYFEKVIETGKSDLAATAAVAIADINVKQEKFDLAIKTYKDVAAASPNLSGLIFPKLGDLYLQLGDIDEAVNFYRKSLDIVPVRQMADVQFKIAQGRQAQGNTDGAVEEYLKVTYLYSEGNNLAVKALLRVASIYEDKENFKEALNFYKKIIEMNVEEAKYARERIEWIKANVK